MNTQRKVVILGAAGRDFHNFNVCFRDNPQYEVIAFTATQIPDIDGRTYPAQLAGDLYPDGIPIADESELAELIPVSRSTSRSSPTPTCLTCPSCTPRRGASRRAPTSGSGARSTMLTSTAPSSP